MLLWNVATCYCLTSFTIELARCKTIYIWDREREGEINKTIWKMYVNLTLKYYRCFFIFIQFWIWRLYRTMRHTYTYILLYTSEKKMTPKMESVRSLSFFATFSSLTNNLPFIIYCITETETRYRAPSSRSRRQERKFLAIGWLWRGRGRGGGGLLTGVSRWWRGGGFDDRGGARARTPSGSRSVPGHPRYTPCDSRSRLPDYSRLVLRDPRIGTHSARRALIQWPVYALNAKRQKR